MKPIFSIIIAVYNNEKYIVAAVESVLQQNIDDIEIIIVDDGSTDRTPEIIDKLALKYRNIKVIHQKNSWIYASFNRGIKEATGKYVYILNSDDKFAPGALIKIRNAIEKYNNPDVVWTKVTLCKSDENQNIYEKKDIRPLIDKEYYWGNGQSNENWGVLITSDLMLEQANAYKRELIQKHLFRNDVYGADHLFNLELIKDIKSFVIIPDEIYLFHQYDNCSNASLGKFYGYEHTMFNEFYTKGLEVLELCNIKTENNISFIINRRKRNYSIEMKNNFKYGKDRLEKKLKEILENSIDDIILEVFDDREELDARILSALRMQLVEEPLDKNSEYYFMYEMLNSLLRYEKEDDDYKKIHDAVYNIKNPFHVGEIFYNRLISSR